MTDKQIIHPIPSSRKPEALSIGFTGTREGMTEGQKTKLWTLLANAIEAHHGDCIGSDEQFHEICAKLEIPIVIHPPDDPKHRAFCQGAIRVEPERPYLVRNQIIVDTCDLLLVAPKEEYEPPPQRGQGTWSCARYARRISRRMRIIWPDGVGLW